MFISWTGGHNKIEGNDIADKAAKEAALTATEIRCKITINTARSLINEKVIEHWQRQWNISTTGYHLKNI